ncbi:amylo-alpha-1,6-glucosidase [Rhodothermus marinus]|jgi:glycogen debranching enzyme|uniref:amylo-alpha-1,6-glucosidase n=1 Tax=Rhodothermus marinus TaxID=29549 RepID=UPI001DB0F418|nr:trehalase family glycosidase [Rhodothermus marinus]MBO2492499.1 glycoside hydrolase [Rhodothermus marinus]
MSEPIVIDPEALIEQARAVLRANDVNGIFIKPGTYQYPHQWNWDAALVALGLSHFDRPRAEQEIRSLLKGQWKDGMLPHVVYHNGASDYFPTPDFWQIERSPNAPEGVLTSGIVQPPLLATCVRLMHERAPDREASLAFVREIYPALYRWHRWLHTARDPENTGLVAIVHPWESGTDNAARFVEPMIRVIPTRVPPYQRRDFLHVREDERPIQAEYQRFVYLIDLFRQWGYDQETIYARSPFLVQDTLFNALMYRAQRDLRALAAELGEPTEEFDEWLATTRYAFNARLWSEEHGLYFAYDLRARRVLEENGCATFIPLFAGLASERQARRLVEEHLLNPEEYAPDGTRYYVPSQAKNNLFFEPRRYWRGPVWIIINWMVMEGLRRYGYHELAETIRQHSLELVQKSGFMEYYDPRDGTGCGATGFSWTAALTIEMLAGQPVPV